MLTSAMIRSGTDSCARANASSPSATVVKATSSKAKVMATAFWMVTESSASKIERGIGAQPPAERSGE
jgi:hypothetical protein